MMTRDEHMAWCKKRALQYIDIENDPKNSFASMMSDLGKHPDTATHIGIKLGMMQMLGGMLRTPDQMRDFINGFN